MSKSGACWRCGKETHKGWLYCIRCGAAQGKADGIEGFVAGEVASMKQKDKILVLKLIMRLRHYGNSEVDKKIEELLR